MSLDWCRDLGGEVVLMGDLNWKPGYRHLLYAGWLASSVAMPTTTLGTSPSRCLHWTSQDIDAPALEEVHFVQGIPLHGLAIFSCEVVEPTRQLTRLRHTACFEAVDTNPVTQEGIADIHSIVDQSCPRSDVEAPLTERWVRWHERG